MKKINKKKDPVKAWNNWFDEHVIVDGFGRGTANKKAKLIIKNKVQQQLMKEYNKGQ